MKPWTWRAAILKSGLPATTRHVLLTLSCYVNDVGESAYPSTKTLAEDTGYSERAVITHLQAASKAGWIIIKKHGFGGQNWARNEYFPTTPDKEFEAKGTEPRSAPDEKALNVATKGTERRSKGTERRDKKALNDVQSNTPIDISKEWSIEKERGQAAPDEFDPIAFLTSKGVSKQVANDWLKIRKTKKLAPTLTSFEDVVAESGKANLSLHETLKTCCVKGWGGFMAKWLQNDQQQPAPSAALSQLGAAGQQTAAAAQRLREKMKAQHGS